LHSNRVSGLKLSAIIILLSSTVFGHGAFVTWEFHGDSVRVSASFDDGQPMDEAQVTVFSGSNPTEAYLVGVTDENGCFSFLPDGEQSMQWDVQVRKAGHGDIVHFSMSEDAQVEIRNGRFSVFQITIMSACVVWGFIGTALFFKSRWKDTDAHT
jgi:nickel transport protein